MGYEKIITLPSNTLQNKVPVSDGTNNYTWVDLPTGKVTSVNNEDGDVVITYGSIGAAPASHYHNVSDISNFPSIPPEVTESTVSGWGFTKNTGTYILPQTGIPKTDLSSSIQNSLNKADSALQSHQSLAAYRTSAEQDIIDNGFQPKISDLENIRSGAQLGSTSVQPSQLNSYTTKLYVDAKDEDLQNQIDAITSKSDVVDVVGTKAELDAYSKHIYIDDVIKVLVDESRNNAITYYRCSNNTTPGSYGWTYIGSQGPFYTKSEIDNAFQPKISDISTIRTNAQTGASHASQTGNPHNTTPANIGAIPNPSTKSTDQVLTWNGSSWVASNIPGRQFIISNSSDPIPTVINGALLIRYDS